MMCNRLMHPFLNDGNTSEGKEELVKVVPDKVAKGGGRQKTKPGVIQRQLTSLGRFTLRSQTEENPSIIAFFLALAHDSDKDLSLHDFQSTWEKRVMEKHERFRCQVSREDDHFFERPLDHYISEIQHPDGKDPKEFSKRIESMLLSPIEVTEKLWQANLSCGPIGTSGAIPDSMNGIKEFEKETILAFRIHHSLCDGVSIAAAVGDLADEAAQLQLNIMEELKLSEKRYQEYFFAVSFLTAFLSIPWFLVACFYSILLQGWKMISSGKNPFDPVIALPNGPVKRSVDWKPIASIEEMKKVAKSISRKTTINDIACAMVSYAVQKQLEEHSKTHNGKVSIPQKVNITVPVHLTGGILRPGDSLGNKIGGFVCTIPINGKKSARDRLRTISRILRREKLLPSPMISWNLARFFTNYLPIHFSKWALRQFSAN
eukprot:scaffold824_cov132-Chaetoceros_neogracile.AAC.8